MRISSVKTTIFAIMQKCPERYFLNSRNAVGHFCLLKKYTTTYHCRQLFLLRVRGLFFWLKFDFLVHKRMNFNTIKQISADNLFFSALRISAVYFAGSFLVFNIRIIYREKAPWHTSLILLCTKELFVIL